MGKQVKKSKSEIATIDCSLVTIETAAGEFGFDTANQIAVEVQVDEQEAIPLIIKGILRAQKPAESTITGNQITLTDNTFNPELVLIIQGGKIIYDGIDPEEIVGYEPPVAGSREKGEVFKLNAYSAQYDASGQIVKYEKISYPNCKGVPIAFNSEDGAFRAPEYTINSAPKTGEPPYSIMYVRDLPALVDTYELLDLELVSIEGTGPSMTSIIVNPGKDEYINKYVSKVDMLEIVLPSYGEIPVGYEPWDGVAEITAATGSFVAIVECNPKGEALAGGQVTAVSLA